MQHEELSTWFILTLSAEQAALDQDFEHLDALLRRRDEILTKWENSGVELKAADLAQVELAEERLATALKRVQSNIGSELRSLTVRQKVAAKYKAA